MTQVLTPQKAAELLKELQYAKVRMGGQLSIRDEYFKQALEQLPRWIACSERMPEPFISVLCFMEPGILDIEEDGYPIILYWSGEKYWKEPDNNDESRSPTHWMSFPEAPL